MSDKKYFTRVPKDIREKAIEMYLAAHPEDIESIAKGRVIKEPEAVQDASELSDSPEPPGHDWPGWRNIAVGQHKKGDWVVGTLCNWRGTKSKDEDIIPGCTEEIPSYQYDGDKYEVFCCELHAILPHAAYTIEEIKHHVRLLSGDKEWCSPLNALELASCILAFKKGSRINPCIGKSQSILMMFNHPIMYSKYSRIYTPDLIEKLIEYRRIDPRIAKMIKSDMHHRGISKEQTANAYGVTVEELWEALEGVK